MPPIPCPGPCNNAWRRAETLRETDGTEHHLTPEWGAPTQCGACVERTRRYLIELPELLTAIHLEALHGTHTKLVATIGRINTPPWPGQAARLLTDRIVGEMTELAADILTQRGIRTTEPHTRAPVSEGRLINHTITTLLAHWDWAMQHHPAATEPHTPGNANPAAQATAWHRAAQRFTKRDPQRVVRRLAPCPRCHGPYLAESRELRLVDDQPYIECRDPDCRRILTRAEYDAYVKELTTAITRAA